MSTQQFSNFVGTDSLVCSCQRLLIESMGMRVGQLEVCIWNYWRNCLTYQVHPRPGAHLAHGVHTWYIGYTPGGPPGSGRYQVGRTRLAGKRKRSEPEVNCTGTWTKFLEVEHVLTAWPVVLLSTYSNYTFLSTLSN